MNRLVLTAIVLVILVIWFSAMAQACTPRGVAGSYWGPSWGPPIFVGGGGGWDRGGFGGSGSSGSGSSPSRSSGGSSVRGGGSGGSGGK